jgi:hypothetical protein
MAFHLMLADPSGNGEVQLRLDGPADPFNFPVMTVTPAFPVAPVVHDTFALMVVVTEFGVFVRGGAYFAVPVIVHCSEPAALKGGALDAPAVDGIARSVPASRTSAPSGRNRVLKRRSRCEGERRRSSGLADVQYSCRAPTRVCLAVTEIPPFTHRSTHAKRCSAAERNSYAVDHYA